MTRSQLIDEGLGLRCRGFVMAVSMDYLKANDPQGLLGKATVRGGSAPDTTSAVPRSSPKASSSLEDELYGQIMAAKLRMPFRQVDGVIPGRKFVFDFGWLDPFSDDVKWVLVEVQGSIHSTVFAKGGGRRAKPSGHNTASGIMRDASKINEAQLAGHVILVVTGPQVKSGQALAWIERALEMKP